MPDLVKLPGASPGEAGVVGLGGILLFASPTLEQPGSSTEWTPAARATTTGARVGGVF